MPEFIVHFQVVFGFEEAQGCAEVALSLLPFYFINGKNFVRCLQINRYHHFSVSFVLGPSNV